MRNFALFSEGLDSVDFDNESAHYWVCFSSIPDSGTEEGSVGSINPEPR